MKEIRLLVAEIDRKIENEPVESKTRKCKTPFSGPATLYSSGGKALRYNKYMGIKGRSYDLVAYYADDGTLRFQKIDNLDRDRHWKLYFTSEGELLNKTAIEWLPQEILLYDATKDFDSESFCINLMGQGQN